MYLHITKSGPHYAGGHLPKDLIVPSQNFKGGIQYIGLINNQDDAFKWLPFSIHMICPIYINWVEVYMDYSDPMAPIVIEEESFDMQSNFDFLDTNSINIFEQHYFESNLVKIDDLSIGDLISPEGDYIKNDFWPICPISKTKMKFVCRIYGSNKLRSIQTNIRVEDESDVVYFNALDSFGNDGELLVFINTETKVICYYIND